ncbi:hypothetical protein BCV70DRAFT_219151, partial [Testicularia cyperi]
DEDHPAPQRVREWVRSYGVRLDNDDIRAGSPDRLERAWGEELVEQPGGDLADIASIPDEEGLDMPSSSEEEGIDYGVRSNVTGADLVRIGRYRVAAPPQVPPPPSAPAPASAPAPVAPLDPFAEDTDSSSATRGTPTGVDNSSESVDELDDSEEDSPGPSRGRRARSSTAPVPPAPRRSLRSAARGAGRGGPSGAGPAGRAGRAGGAGRGASPGSDSSLSEPSPTGASAVGSEVDAEGESVSEGGAGDAYDIISLGTSDGVTVGGGETDGTDDHLGSIRVTDAVTGRQWWVSDDTREFMSTYPFRDCYRCLLYDLDATLPGPSPSGPVSGRASALRAPSGGRAAQSRPAAGHLRLVLGVHAGCIVIITINTAIQEAGMSDQDVNMPTANESNHHSGPFGNNGERMDGDTGGNTGDSPANSTGDDAADHAANHAGDITGTNTGTLSNTAAGGNAVSGTAGHHPNLDDGGNGEDQGGKDEGHDGTTGVGWRSLWRARLAEMKGFRAPLTQTFLARTRGVAGGSRQPGMAATITGLGGRFARGRSRRARGTPPRQAVSLHPSAAGSDWSLNDEIATLPKTDMVLVWRSLRPHARVNAAVKRRFKKLVFGDTGVAFADPPDYQGQDDDEDEDHPAPQRVREWVRSYGVRLDNDDIRAESPDRLERAWGEELVEQPGGDLADIASIPDEEG